MAIKPTKRAIEINTAYQTGRAQGQSEGEEKARKEIAADTRRRQLDLAANTLTKLADAFGQSMEAQARAVIEITKAISTINNTKP